MPIPAWEPSGVEDRRLRPSPDRRPDGRGRSPGSLAPRREARHPGPWRRWSAASCSPASSLLAHVAMRTTDRGENATVGQAECVMRCEIAVRSQVRNAPLYLRRERQTQGGVAFGKDHGQGGRRGCSSLPDSKGSWVGLLYRSSPVVHEPRVRLGRETAPPSIGGAGAY